MSVCASNLILRVVLLLLFAMISGLMAPSIAKAEINPAGLDAYLEREFSYVFSISAGTLPSYFEYEGSKLRPVTRVLVRLHRFNSDIEDSSAQRLDYEEYWYHRGLPLGSRRMAELNLAQHELGAIVLRKLGSGSDQLNAAANAALRIFLDLQMKKLNTAVMLVPFEAYDPLAVQLQSYGFLPLTKMNQDKQLNGKQLSILLKSYPAGLEGQFYYQK